MKQKKTTPPSPQAKPLSVTITVNPRNVNGTIDERIYGHFLEHIFHSVNGGLFGEMVWDCSFEDWQGDERGRNHWTSSPRGRRMAAR